MDSRIIAIDDELSFLESIRRGLRAAGYRNVLLEQSAEKAAEMFINGEVFDIALIDITMKGMDGLELLDIIKTHSPDTECIMLTAIDEARTAVNAMKQGAYDYLVKPIERETLLLSLNRVSERKRLYKILDLAKGGKHPELSHEDAFKDIVTGSKNILRILKEAELHAASNVPILITGESGTGKELLAKAIHLASPRADYPFTPVNMASLTPTLFDAEFFGHTKGAFTGANIDRAGYLEYSNKGSIFLDEIGTLPMELQGKLLRVLQNGEYIKIGTDKPRITDVRFIAATNEEVDKLISKKIFRKDLYYRLKGGWLHLPPLRDRGNDIPVLISRFLEEYSTVGEAADISDGALSILENYDFPGNIRELKGIIQSAVNLSKGKTITASHLPENIKKDQNKKKILQEDAGPVLTLAQVEKDHILRVYGKTGENKSQTARLLDIGLNTLRRKLESYEV